MNRAFLRRCLGLCLLVQTSLVARPTASPQAEAAPQVVKRAVVDPGVPVFVPVHPRIATTISFPRPIGEPMGTGFVHTDAMERAAVEGKEMSSRGEYAISYVQGENYFSVQPLLHAELLNLNVPYEGTTIVLYFYVVQHPLQAVASLVFQSGEPNRSVPAPEQRPHDPRDGTRQSAPPSIERRESAPPSPFATASPARIEGFLRKLRLVHAAKLGSELEDLAAAMKLSVAVSLAEGVEDSAIQHPASVGPTHELVLLRAVRDQALDAVGFVVLLRNKTDQDLLLDLRTFSARCGSALYTAMAVDASPLLKAREQRAGYFVIVGAGDQRPGHLSADNDWRLSVATLPSVVAETGAKE